MIGVGSIPGTAGNTTALVRERVSSREERAMGSVRLAGFLCAFGSIAALGVVVASCSPGAVEYATDGFVVCEETVDCYEGLHYFPGTRCLGGRCKCPVEGDVQCCP